MKITGFGWGMAGVILFSLYVACKIHGRMFGKPLNLLVAGFVALVLLCLNFPIYGFSCHFVGSSYSLIFGNKYNAVVVDYNVSAVTTSRPRSRGMPYGLVNKRNYTAVVEYQNQAGETVRNSVNYGFSRPPVVGEIIIISDKNIGGTVNDISVAQSVMYLFGIMLVAVLFSISFFLSCYGFGLEHQKNRRLTAMVLLVCVMAGLLGYALNFFTSVSV